MGTAAAGQFGCDTCGKLYRWKPELAGKRAKCKCGSVLVCPSAEPPSEPPSDEPDIFDIAPTPLPPKPAPRVTTAPATIAATTPAIPMPTTANRAKTLEYRAEPSASTKTFPNPLMDLWAPLWVFVIALFVECMILQRIVNNSAANRLPSAMRYMFLALAVKTLLLACGMSLAVKHRGIQAGSYASAALKLFAIAVAPSATMDLLTLATQFIPLGFLINWVCGFIVYFALIGTFFDLDQEDTWYCVQVVLLINIFVTLWPVLWHYLMGR